MVSKYLPRRITGHPARKLRCKAQGISNQINSRNLTLRPGDVPGDMVTVVGLPVDEKMRVQYIVDGFMEIISGHGYYIGEYIPIEELHPKK